MPFACMIVASWGVDYLKIDGVGSDDVNVKWGVYGASDTEVSDYVDDQRIGTSYADVD
jgi:hypothetical protein